MKLLTLICVISLVLFFVGGPDYYSPRSYKHFWDLGHIFFFSIFTYLVVSTWNRISRTPFLKQCFWLLLISFFLGLLIEGVQVGLARTPSVGDVTRNLIGALVTLAFFAPSRRTIPKTSLRVLQCSVILLILLEVFPLARALTDESIARKQFPILSDFETPFEICRWSEDIELAINEQIVSHGKHSLRVSLTTDQYSGVFLNYFPNDWRNFNSLQFSVFNPNADPLKIKCLVHDNIDMTNREPLEEWFIRSIMVSHGWNEVSISLKDVVNAPKGREMDMSHIRSFGIYVKGLEQPKVIYIDNVRLVR